MSLFRKTLVVVSMLVAVVTTNVARAESNANFTGTFSSVCRHGESGDLLGIEVSFIPDASGIWMLVQRYEGVPTRPTLLSIGRPNDNRISTKAKSVDGDFFVVDILPNDSLRIRYMNGQVSRTGSDSEMLYKRVSPNWSSGGNARIPVCK
jgi:hypothetical protein